MELIKSTVINPGGSNFLFSLKITNPIKKLTGGGCGAIGHYRSSANTIKRPVSADHSVKPINWSPSLFCQGPALTLLQNYSRCTA